MRIPRRQYLGSEGQGRYSGSAVWKECGRDASDPPRLLCESTHQDHWLTYLTHLYSIRMFHVSGIICIKNNRNHSIIQRHTYLVSGSEHLSYSSLGRRAGAVVGWVTWGSGRGRYISSTPPRAAVTPPLITSAPTAPPHRRLHCPSGHEVSIVTSPRSGPSYASCAADTLAWNNTTSKNLNRIKIGAWHTHTHEAL